MPYPIPPGPRIAYDSNGSIGLVRGTDALVYQLVQAGLAVMNGERSEIGRMPGSGDSGNPKLSPVYPYDPRDQYLAILFPVSMRLYGFFCNVHLSTAGTASAGVACDIYTSPNTTNGDDGTWTFLYQTPAYPGSGAYGSAVSGVDLVSGNTFTNYYMSSLVVNDAYRKTEADQGISSVSGVNTRHLRGMKIVPRSNVPYSSFWKLHLYGEPDTDASENLLVFWDPEDDASIGPQVLDWGDVPQGSTADRSFRIKNNSSAQTANSIVISAGMGYTTTSPVPSDSMLFSFDGNTWTPTVSLAALSPGAVSGQIGIRRTTPLNAVPSNWAPRVIATVGSWT